MQVSQPQTMRDKIVVATTKYLSQADQWSTVAIIQEHTVKLVDYLQDVVGIQAQPKRDREPQSESEEVKGELDFESAVVKEVRKFVEGLKNFKIVQEADMADLKTRRANILNEIEALGKFKDVYKGDFEEVVAKMSK